MLKQIEITNIGPARKLTFKPGRRTTLLAGENSRGRTLILDSAWRTLSGTWPSEASDGLGTGYPAFARPGAQHALVESVMTDAQGYAQTHCARWRRSDHRWQGSSLRSDTSAVYAHANGAVSAWVGKPRHGLRRRAVSLKPAEIWAGEPRRATVEEEERWPGAATAVGGWRMNREQHDVATAALECCVPKSCRGVDDGRLSALAERAAENAVGGSGMERFGALAMIIAWVVNTTWHQARENGLLLIVDDIESHLGPKAQREALGGLRRMETHVTYGGPLQLIAATNAPLVLASAEPWFDNKMDQLVTLRRNEVTGDSTADHEVFTPRGTADNWLTSETIGLPTERNIEAERAILEARAILAGNHRELERIEQADQALRRTLPDDDQFWVRWNVWMDEIRKSAI